MKWGCQTLLLIQFLVWTVGCKSQDIRPSAEVLREPQSVSEECRRHGETHARLIFNQMGSWPSMENLTCGDVIRGRVTSRGRALTIQAGTVGNETESPLSTFTLTLFEEDGSESASVVFDDGGARVMFCQLPGGASGCMKFASLGRLFSPLQSQTFSEHRLQVEFRNELRRLTRHRHAPLDQEIYEEVMGRESDLLSLIRLARGLRLRPLCDACQNSSYEVLAYGILQIRQREYGLSSGS